jgi:hypothetical protein
MPVRKSNTLKAAAEPGSVGRAFDLNIEKVLESWSVSHALREMLANALDERALSDTAPIEIKDINGGPIQTLAEFAQQWAASIEYRFVAPEDLSSDEQRIYALWRQIVELFGGRPTRFKDLKISETMRPSVKEGMHPAGLWDSANGWVIIHRPELRSVSAFAGTLLHELVHARTGYDDLSRDFELTLTNLIDRLASRLVGIDAISDQPGASGSAAARRG